MARFVPGAVIGDRFEIVGPLGRGGMATVWLAQDRLRGERVALKVLHDHLATEPAMRARLRREVQAAGRVRHPCALVAHELHELDGQLVLSMPVHPGASLADHVAEGGPLPAKDLHRLLDDIGGALAAAHAEGVLHRDVTPNNVLVGADGRFMLVDFGLARLEGQASTTGHTGALGTAGYAAPEVYRGVRTDPRSDLYGLGATVWFAATGKAPFEAPNPMGVLEKQLTGALPALGRADLPAGFEDTLRGLLAVEPDERPDGADGALDAARGEAPVARMGRAAGLPKGSWSVVVTQSTEQRERRPSRNREGRRFLTTIKKHARDLDARLGDVVETGIAGLGLLEPSPHERLAAAVSTAAGLPADALVLSEPMGQRRFRLVADVDEPTALALAQQANQLGFRAEVTQAADRPGIVWWPILLAVAVFLVAMVLLPVMLKTAWPTMFFGLFLFGWPIKALFGGQGASLPVAYGDDLRPLLDPKHAALAPKLDPNAPDEARSVSERVLARVAAIRGRLGALPPAAGRDLEGALARIEARAAILDAEVRRLGALVGERDEAKLAAAATRVEARIQRLSTLHASGQPVDAGELIKLEATLTGHRTALAAAAEDEAHLARLQGELLSLSAAVSRADRSLSGAPDSADAASELLAHVARVEAVREEMARKPEDPVDRARRAAAARREAGG